VKLVLDDLPLRDAMEEEAWTSAVRVNDEHLLAAVTEEPNLVVERVAQNSARSLGSEQSTEICTGFPIPISDLRCERPRTAAHRSSPPH